MNLLILAITAIFLCLLGIAGFLFFKDAKEKPVAGEKEKSAPAKKTRGDILVCLEKKVSAGEEKIRLLEDDLKNTHLELQKALGREQTLQQQKTQTAFDASQLEKLKKDFDALKNEAADKEKTLEREISLRRQQSAELQETQKEHGRLRKKLADTEDSLRKSEAATERLTQERDAARKIVADQQKIVQEHAENKSVGEWVSRQELEKLERELKEKENLLQRLLSLKTSSSPQPPSAGNRP